MSTGRTSPALFACETANGRADYVVKLRGGMERPGALVCELYASMLAQFLDVSTPAPAIVQIEKELADAVARSIGDSRRSDIMKESEGLNFGSSFIANMHTWPIGKHVPPAMHDAAAEIFAFDALVQNPDRKFNNPNLGMHDGKFVVFDHESAFSFLLALFPQHEPWKLTKESYLGDHPFARTLKGKCCTQSFIQRLKALSDTQLRDFASQIPKSWNATGIPKIEAHLRLVREHAQEFAEEVERRLA